MANRLTDALFNSNDYRRGKEEGYAAGLAGKDMSFIGMGTSLKSWIHPEAMDTYAEGYKAGYALGSSQRLVQQSLRKTATKTAGAALPGHNSSQTFKQQSTMTRGIDGQIELLESLKRTLEGVSESLGALNGTLNGAYEEMDEEGLDETVLGRIEEMDEQVKEKISAAIEIIDEQSVPYIDGVISYLEELL